MLAVAISKGWRELSSSMWRNILQTSILRASVLPATWSCRDLTKLPRRGLHMNTLWRYMSGYHMTLRSAESVHKLVVQLLYTFLHNILRHWTDHRGQRSTKRIQSCGSNTAYAKHCSRNNWRKLYLRHGELRSGSLSTVLQCASQARPVVRWYVLPAAASGYNTTTQ